jgi:kynureninase
MVFNSTKISLAQELDRADELRHFRDEFVIPDPVLVYLDGNSLGRLPKRTGRILAEAVEIGWGERLIRSWNDGWFNAPSRIGSKIAGLIGARPDEVILGDSTSVNLFKLAVAALRYKSGRLNIVSDVLNFPSDLYILQGITDLFGGRHRLELIPSTDGLTVSSEVVKKTVDDQTALATFSHVAFKSAFLYDAQAVTEMAHEAGALVLWDLSHSVGSVPVELNRWDADLAVGCTYKYLNGGPGSPAFLYVRRDLQGTLLPAIWGWFGSQAPFEFNLDFSPSREINRFNVGTPPVLSMLAVEPAVDLLLEAGIKRLREKSIRQCEYLIYLAEQWLFPLGFELGSPRESSQRGSHVSLKHSEGYRISRALVESDPPAVRVIPDFREPDIIRFGIAPIYTTFTEIHRGISRLRQIVEDKIYLDFNENRLGVT